MKLRRQVLASNVMLFYSFFFHVSAGGGGTPDTQRSLGLAAQKHTKVMTILFHHLLVHRSVFVIQPCSLT
jgi:hypothetical protein